MRGTFGEGPRGRRTAAWALTLALLGAAGVAVAASAPQAGESDQADERPTKLVKMYADNWKWTPDVLRVVEGTRVVIRFESRDAPHSFVLKQYGIKVPLPQDSKVETEFVANQVGTFRWKCGRPCGDGCPKMTGKLIVQPAEPAPEGR